MVRPSDLIQGELRRALEVDKKRLGEVYRLTQRGLNPEQIAAQLDVPTSGFVSNQRIMIAALMEGRMPGGPAMAVQVRDAVRRIAKTPGLSSDAVEYLTELEARLQPIIGDYRRSGQVETSPRQQSGPPSVPVDYAEDDEVLSEDLAPDDAVVAFQAGEPELRLPDATAELARRLHLDRAWLQECVELLRDRPQLIFYGPPGTGKTYVAQALASHLAGEHVRLVQFHPAYSYEDFFEGFRPKAGGGFELRSGPMRKVVAQAAMTPSVPHVLIIDEINRGNLAKIFGELYFLLEYRDQTADLLYASDETGPFSLPRNVIVIGTMNTADRSIALVDAAMRRRFAFVALHPSEEPVAGVLRRWLVATGRPHDAADLLDELNRRIDDPDFKIGPSYFMRPAVYDEGGLERVWRTAILPLLEEHHFGESIDVQARYGMDAIRRAVSATHSAAQADADEATSPGPAYADSDAH